MVLNKACDLSYSALKVSASMGFMEVLGSLRSKTYWNSSLLTVSITSPSLSWMIRESGSYLDATTLRKSMSGKTFNTTSFPMLYFHLLQRECCKFFYPNQSLNISSPFRGALTSVTLQDLQTKPSTNLFSLH